MQLFVFVNLRIIDLAIRQDLAIHLPTANKDLEDSQPMKIFAYHMIQNSLMIVGQLFTPKLEKASVDHPQSPIPCKEAWCTRKSTLIR